MKNFSCALFLLGFICLAFSSCGEKDDPMDAARVYFPLAAKANANGVYEASFDYSRDTTFLIAAYCSGSLMNDQNLRVELELAVDSLQRAAALVPAIAQYELLPASAYTVTPDNLQLTIRKGEDRAGLSVQFHTTSLDPDKKYILPLGVASVSAYEIAGSNHYLFFGITKQ